MLLLAAVVMMGYFGFIANSIYRSVGSFGFGWILIALGLAVVSLFTLITGLYSVNTVLFEGRDLDQLFTYPISPLQILFSKVLALVAENLIVGIVFFLPVFTVYCYYEKPDTLTYIYSILAFICTPLLPVCIFILLAYFLNLLTNGMRAKNTIKTVITIGLIVGSAIGIQNLVSGFKTSRINLSDIFAGFKTFYPPLGYLMSGIVKGNFGDLLIGLLWNIVPFVVLCAVLSFGYQSLWTRARVTHKSLRKKLSFGVQSQFATLLQKEFSRYFSSVMYVLNSSVGMILMTIFTIVVSKSGGKKIQQLEQLFPTDMKILLFLLIFGFTLAVSNTTASSISLEGKNLWILKSSPVDEGKILLAKLCVHLGVTIPLLTVNCIIANFTTQLSIVNCLILFAICSLFSVLSGLTGLIFNLFYPRFDFYSDMQVVKNSLSVLLTLLTMAVFVVAFAEVYWQLRANIILNWYLLGISTVLTVFTILAAAFVFTKGKKILKNIS